MNGKSRPLKGLGPYNIKEVAIGLAALGVAGVVWGIFTMVELQIPGLLPLIGGLLLLVAGVVVWRWDLTHRV